MATTVENRQEIWVSVEEYAKYIMLVQKFSDITNIIASPEVTDYPDVALAAISAIIKG